MWTMTLMSLVVLFLASAAALAHSAWWLFANRRRRQPAADRAQLRLWARDVGIEPRRFERAGKLRARIVREMTPRRASAAGIAGLDNKRAARA